MGNFMKRSITRRQLLKGLSATMVGSGIQPAFFRIVRLQLEPVLVDYLFSLHQMGQSPTDYEVPTGTETNFPLAPTISGHHWKASKMI